MTNKRSKGPGYSRHKARQIMKELHPDLKSTDIIHHKDGDPFNNDIDNLQIMSSHKEHLSLHAKVNLEFPNLKNRLDIIDYMLTDIDPEFWHRVKIYSVTNKISIKQLILNLLFKHLEKEGGQWIKDK